MSKTFGRRTKPVDSSATNKRASAQSAMRLPAPLHCVWSSPQQTHRPSPDSPGQKKRAKTRSSQPRGTPKLRPTRSWTADLVCWRMACRDARLALLRSDTMDHVGYPTSVRQELGSPRGCFSRHVSLWPVRGLGSLQLAPISSDDLAGHDTWQSSERFPELSKPRVRVGGGWRLVSSSSSRGTTAGQAVPEAGPGPTLEFA